jgi:hypothetical protein
MSEYHGHMTLADGSHVPLTKEQGEDLWNAAMAAKAKRAEEMPDIQAALRVMTNAYHRLEELGFTPAIYCPKDGSAFEVIEAGSSGIHRCHYSGEWPTGSWLIEDGGDLWPSSPILFRLYPDDAANRKAKMATAAETYALEGAAERGEKP